MRQIIKNLKNKLDLEFEFKYNKKYKEWIVWNEEFLMYGEGCTKEEAVEDLYISLNENFEHYLNIPDNELTLDGLKFKNKIKKII